MSSARPPVPGSHWQPARGAAAPACTGCTRWPYSRAVARQLRRPSTTARPRAEPAGGPSRPAAPVQQTESETLQFSVRAGLGRLPQPEHFQLLANACYRRLTGRCLLRSRRTQVRILWACQSTTSARTTPKEPFADFARGDWGSIRHYCARWRCRARRTVQVNSAYIEKTCNLAGSGPRLAFSPSPS